MTDPLPAIPSPDEEIDALHAAVTALLSTMHARTVERDRASAAAIRAGLASSEPFECLRALAMDLDPSGESEVDRG